MEVTQVTLTSADELTAKLQGLASIRPNFLLAFGAESLLKAVALPLATAFASATRVGCTTAGEISSQGVADGTIVRPATP